MAALIAPAPAPIKVPVPIPIPIKAPVPAEAPKKKYDVPDVKNYSQFNRAARLLFGPLVRVRTYPGEVSHTVTVEAGHDELSLLAYDQPTYRDALQVSLDTCLTAHKQLGALPRGVMPTMAFDQTKAIRSHLAMAVAGDKTASRAFSRLHDHEALAFHKNAEAYAQLGEDDPGRPPLKAALDQLLAQASAR